MALIDFMYHIHKSTNRDYIGRVNDMDYPKARAAKLCKDWGFEYWDGDRRICYGGYQYIPGRWAPVGKAIIEHYGLKPGDKILDIGCGKGYQLYELTQLMPGIEVYGIDISEYAIQNGKEEIKHRLKVCSATNLPFPDNYFDFVFSLNVLHNLPNYDLVKALQEMERVGAKDKYLCVESFRNEVEKVNLLYWQVTCSAFCSPEEWGWWFKTAGYTGDHSFIFFE